MSAPPQPALAPADDAVLDRWMVAVMRCMLAVSATLIFLVERLKPERLVFITYLALVLYCAYALWLALSVYRGRSFLPEAAHHWIDIAFYTLLLGLTLGTESAFFFFFLFAILAGAFRGGFREGIAATLVCVAAYVGVGLPISAGRPGFELDRTLVQAVFLFVLGYLISYWGGHELSLRRRLRLLRDLATVPNARLGADHAVTEALRRLVAFYAADVCVLVCPRPGAAGFVMYRVDERDAASPQPSPLTEASARALLEFEPSLSVSWNPKSPSRDCPPELCRRLANLLETSYFVTVPFRPQEGMPGRLYLASQRRAFGHADADFVRQAVAQIAAVVHNLMLLDELMENATQLQRSRISRDIHDTAVQPYIGLKLALEALYRKCDPASPLAAQVRELREMTELTVADLRGYIARLREHEPAWGGEQLIAALREHIERYRHFYGLEIELVADENVSLADRVAGEAFNLVCEALSNVYRHAGAKRAFVELRRRADALTIRVGNEPVAGRAGAPFTPRSIAERAAALGGTTRVHNAEGRDVVEVTIPL